MNFYGMRTQYDRIARTVDDSDFTAYRDDFLNQSWKHISQMFLIPSLKREVYVDVVEDQATYLFPYDYNGAEVHLWFKSTSTGSYRRLDPVEEETLALMYERRSGNMGSVLYYDWTNPAGSDSALRDDCVLTNNSDTVDCVNAAAADADNWIRFDPFSDANGDTQDPGDYGYLIESVTAGASYTLDRAYRGPASTVANPVIGRVQPAEQQQFIVYGTPTADVTDGFHLKYYATPRRLYNDADVPEWPPCGIGIVYLAVSIGYDYLHMDGAARVWWGRAMGRLTGLQRRKEVPKTLVTDLTIGSVVGRKTGPRGVILKHSR